jgi:D-glycero-D-manno-heptose 1,7-bisphosphate phosphatase
MKLVIIDRDGVINQDSDLFIKTVDEFIPLPGSLEAIARLNQAGYKVAIATNQSGIARGYYDIQTLEAMHDKLSKLLIPLNGHIDYITFCPHGPDDSCTCRKPLPGMYQEIAEHFNISLEGVPVVGDSMRDLEAAIAVNAKPILVRTGKGDRTLSNNNLDDQIPVFDNLQQAVNSLIINIK